MKSSQYMSITVFDAMSLKNLDDSYIWWGYIVKPLVIPWVK